MAAPGGPGAGPRERPSAQLDSDSPERREALQQMFNANGIREEEVKHPERVTNIEMVLDDYCCMQSLKFFSNLKSVCLIQQAICKIEGLEWATGLERLLLNENRIEKVEGLSGCTKLKELHICINAIQELGTGLAGLMELEVLWIAENQLTELKGLEHAPNLMELNAARNRLTTVVHAFDRNSKLRSINVADNRICSFRDILDLSRIIGLRELSFADPDWGENPICLLCNYQTYTLYHLPSLKILDRMRIAEDEHQQAEVAFSRKRLYYNMRIKLLKRHASDALRAAKSLNEERAAAVRCDIEAASRTLRRIDGSAQVREHNPVGTWATQEAEPTDGRDRIAAEKQLKESQAELEDAALVLEALRSTVRSERQALTRGLQLELQTGGNVRMEPGTPEREPWARQIQELVQARFRSDEFVRFGIADVKVQQVTRVHNRSLRIRFEELLDRLDLDGSSRQLEYLFYVPDPRRAAEHLRAVAEEGPGGGSGAGITAPPRAGRGTPELEHGPGPGARPGPRPPEEEDGRDEGQMPTVLTNSVSLAEGARLECFLRTASGQAQSRAARRGVARQRAWQPPGWQELGVQPPAWQPGMSAGGGSSSSSALAGGSGEKTPGVVSGTLLLCSAYLAEQLLDEPPAFDAAANNCDVRALWQREPSQLGPLPARVLGPKVPPELSAPVVYRTRCGDTKQKVWKVSNTDLVLPEYLVEIDYVYSSELLQSHVEERKAAEYGPFAAPLRDFAFFTKISAPPKAARSEEEAEAEANSGGRRAGSKAAGLPDVPQMEQLDGKRLAQLLSTGPGTPLGGAPLAGIKVLNLHGRGLRRIEAGALRPLEGLQTLLLSFNCFASLSALPACPTVTCLDFSFNFVEKVSALSALPALQRLDLSWNSLGLSLEVRDLDAAAKDVLSCMARDLPRLEVLCLSGNPMANSLAYRATALSKLPHLRSLDDRDVSEAEVQEAKEHAARLEGGALVEAVLMERAFASPSQGSTAPSARRPGPSDEEMERYRVAALLGGGSSSSGAHGVGPRIQGLTRSNWKGFTECVDLRDMGLSALAGLTGFTQLRRLRLCGNRLTSLEKLAACAALEELSVERNLLSTLTGAGSLPELRRLDAGSNRICDILDIKKLTKLSQLSLEDNLIDSLDTFAALLSLAELYLSSNLVEEMRSVLLLKQLPRLLVLDLAGNDLCNEAEYRLYTIFHLKRLKVLDGIPLVAAEQHEAEEKFSGRITMELLEDKLGPSPSCYNFRSVDLSSQSLKELGQLLNDDVFPSLRELNIDGNPVTDIRSVGPLSKLLVLKANRSKIDLEKGMLADPDSGGGIASMPHLQVLELGHSGLTDISFFANFPLPALRILHLPGNEISKVEGLSHLEQLRELVLDKNKVKQIDEHSFEGLRSLRELRMDDNGLKSLANIGPLPRLRALHLALNRIAELSELEKLRNLRHVVIVNLSQNPVARKPLYRAHLINSVASARAIDGREVTDEERERAEQLQQGSDPTRQQMGNMYIFNDQAQAQVGAAPLTFLVPSMMGGAELITQQKVAGGGGAAPTYEKEGLHADGRRDGGAGNAARRAAASQHPGNAADNGEARKPQNYAARSHSVPRHVGLEYRPAVMPPGAGR